MSKNKLSENYTDTLTEDLLEFDIHALQCVTFVHRYRLYYTSFNLTTMMAFRPCFGSVSF